MEHFYRIYMDREAVRIRSSPVPITYNHFNEADNYASMHNYHFHHGKIERRYNLVNDLVVKLVEFANVSELSPTEIIDFSDFVHLSFEYS